MMPTDWHKIQVSIDLEGSLRKIQWPFAAEFTPSRAMVEYFLKKLRLGKMGNFNPFIYALLNESPWRTYFKDNRKMMIPMLDCSLILEQIMGPWARRFSP